MISFLKNGFLKWNNLSLIKKMVITSCISILLIAFLSFVLIFYDSMGGFDKPAIIKYRLPRIPLLIILGVGTPLSAFLIQKLTKNKLADTGLIGVSDSGVFALSILYIYFPKMVDPINNPLTISLVTPLVIAISSFITLMLLYVLSIKKGVSPKRVIITGIGLHILFSGASTLMIYFNNGYDMNFFSRYLIGFIEKKSKIIWIIALSFIFICILIIWIIGTKLDIIESDENLAKSVGIKTELLKFFVFLIIPVIVGITVAAVGSVALLGLFIPNIARSIVGNKTRSIIWINILFGILFVFIAQFININLMHIGAPIGILLQLIIAPYFIYKIIRGFK